jgi:hypothetical protein
MKLIAMVFSGLLVATHSWISTQAQDRLAEILPPDPAVHVECQNLSDLFRALGRQHERVAGTNAWQAILEKLKRSEYELAYQQVEQLPVLLQGPLSDRLQAARQTSLTVYRSAGKEFDYLFLVLWDLPAKRTSQALREAVEAWDPETAFQEMGSDVWQIRIGQSPERQSQAAIYAVCQEPFSIVSNNLDLAKETARAVDSGAAHSLAKNLRYKRVSRLHHEHTVRVYLNPAELKQLLGLPTAAMRLEQGQVAAVGGGLTLQDGSRQWLKASASLALTTPTEGVFRGLQLARPVTTPPVNQEYVTALQGLSFQWTDLFGFLETSFDAVLGKRFFRNQVETEGAYQGISYDQVRDMFQSWNGSVFVGYVTVPEKNYFGMFYCYQLKDSTEAEKFVVQQMKMGTMNRNYPMKKQQVEDFQAWYRDKETLARMQRQYLRNPHEQTEEQAEFLVGSEALVIVDRWVISCAQGAIKYLVAEQNLDHPLGGLDTEIDRVIKEQSRAALPFCLRLVKPVHWKVKYADSPPIVAQRGEQAPPNRGELDADTDSEPARPDRQRRATGLNGRPLVNDEELLAAVTQLFYDEFGGHVIAGYAEESFLKFEITAFAHPPSTEK